MSAEPTTDFTVSITNDAGTTFAGAAFVGFVSPRVFCVDDQITGRDGVYTLLAMNGCLFGPGCNMFGTNYCTGFASGTLRCVVDRAAQTISFYVNGVSCGVAWNAVAAGALHAFASLSMPGTHVELCDE